MREGRARWVGLLLSALLVVFGCSSDGDSGDVPSDTTSTAGTGGEQASCLPGDAQQIDAEPEHDDAPEVWWLDAMVGTPLVPLQVRASNYGALTVVGLVRVGTFEVEDGYERPIDRLLVLRLDADGNLVWSTPIGDRLPIWFTRTVPLDVRVTDAGEVLVSWPRPLADPLDPGLYDTRKVESDPAELVVTTLGDEGQPQSERVLDADTASSVHVAGNGEVVVIEPAGQLTVFAEDGQPRWRENFGARYPDAIYWNVPVAPRAITIGDCVIAAVPLGPDPQASWELVAMARESGARIWSEPLDGDVTALAVTDDRIAVGTPASPWIRTYKLADGTRGWSAGDERTNTYPISIVDAEPMLVLGNSEGTDTSEYVIWQVAPRSVTPLGSFGLCCGMLPGTSAADIDLLSDGRLVIAGSDGASDETFLGDDDPVHGGFVVVISDPVQLGEYLRQPFTGFG